MGGSWRRGLPAGHVSPERQHEPPGNGDQRRRRRREPVLDLGRLPSGGRRRSTAAAGWPPTPTSTSGDQTFYFAQIEQVHAGKTLEIELFDPGDVSGDAFLRFLSPDGNAYNYATFNYVADSQCTSG